MRYRILSDTGDYVFGGGIRDFYVNQPEAVGQAVKTRLNLYLGEWFLDTNDGTPWYTKVLGTHTQSTKDIVLQARITGTPGFNSMLQYASLTDPNTRLFSVLCTINTIYGTTTVSTSL